MIIMRWSNTVGCDQIYTNSPWLRSFPSILDYFVQQTSPIYTNGRILCFEDLKTQHVLGRWPICSSVAKRKITLWIISINEKTRTWGHLKDNRKVSMTNFVFIISPIYNFSALKYLSFLKSTNLLSLIIKWR